MGFGFGVRDECGGEVGEEMSEIWVWVWIVIGGGRGYSGIHYQILNQ